VFFSNNVKNPEERERGGGKRTSLLRGGGEALRGGECRTTLTRGVGKDESLKAENDQGLGPIGGEKHRKGG